MKKDLTRGNVTRNMLLFAGPMILGNLLQQFYNIADTLIVGQFLGPNALAAVGSAYTLMAYISFVSSRSAPLLGLSPLRTVHESFPSHGSSNALLFLLKE